MKNLLTRKTLIESTRNKNVSVGKCSLEDIFEISILTKQQGCLCIKTSKDLKNEYMKRLKSFDSRFYKKYLSCDYMIVIINDENYDLIQDLFTEFICEKKKFILLSDKDIDLSLYLSKRRKTDVTEGDLI